MTDVLLGHLFPRFLLEDRNGRAMAEAIRAALTLLCGTARQLTPAQPVFTAPYAEVSR